MPPKRAAAKSYLYARMLRKEPTPAERVLWLRLRNNQLGVSFRRQHAIGSYVVDFCCIKKKLIIELDGEVHKSQQGYDTERMANIESLGYQMLRFWNQEVMGNVEGVIDAIQRKLEEVP